ncbi:MAG TPA: hypothetical protein DCK81_05580 [Clostridiales bacterium UBA9856]|jgi:hypothetical protein|nr:hypothetical protein [Clostridiales bacterium UBA9856]HOA42467.1 hypothetical protein [Bacillota bacterium]
MGRNNILEFTFIIEEETKINSFSLVISLAMYFYVGEREVCIIDTQRCFSATRKEGSCHKKGAQTHIKYSKIPVVPLAPNVGMNFAIII